VIVEIWIVLYSVQKRHAVSGYIELNPGWYLVAIVPSERMQAVLDHIVFRLFALAHVARISPLLFESGQH